MLSGSHSRYWTVVVGGHSFFNIYLCSMSFIGLYQVLVVACRIFHCRAQTLWLWLTGSVVAALGLSSCVVPVLEDVGFSNCSAQGFSTVVHGLNCSSVYGILVSQPRDGICIP